MRISLIAGSSKHSEHLLYVLGGHVFNWSASHTDCWVLSTYETTSSIKLYHRLETAGY
jgi:hypothetical protein